MLNNSPEVWSWQYTNIRSTFYSSSRSFLFLYFSYSVFSCSVISCIAVVCCCFVQGNLFSWLCVFGCWVLKLSQKLGYFSFPSNEYIHAIYLAIHLHTFVFIMLLIQHSMPMHCLKYATFFLLELHCTELFLSFRSCQGFTEMLRTIKLDIDLRLRNC